MKDLQCALGDSPAMRALGERLLRVVSTGARRLPPILIEGETGTGKSYLAATLHQVSARANEPFVSVNCAAIPRELLEAELFGYERGAFTGARGAKPGLFQFASRGTLFLDEINFLDESLQAKLLTVLEERSVRRLGATRSEPVDLWIMAATNVELRRTSREGKFLESLFHRLAVIGVRLPPLRERADDTIPLAEKLLARACAHYEVAPKLLTEDARMALRAYSFPGNIRELGNIMERVALLQSGQLVTRAMLELPDEAPADEVAPPSSSDDPDRLIAALQANDWNISRAAAQLGLPRSTLRSRIQRHGLCRAKARAERPPPIAAAPVPQRMAILQFVPDRSAEELPLGATSIQLSLGKARAFGSHATSSGTTSGRALFLLERFEDGARTVVAAARAIARVLAAHGSDYRLLLHLGCFTSDDEIDRAMPADAEIEKLPAGLLFSDAAATLVRRQIESEPLTAGGWHRISRIAAFATETARGLAPLVGRELEVALLRQRLEAAKLGHGQLIGIQGDAGIGKSRLVAEMLPAAAELGFLYVEGACPAHGRTMPYLPVIEIVRTLSCVTERDDALQLAAKLDARLERLGIGSELAAPLLRLLGVGAPDAGATPEGGQAQIRQAVATFILTAAREAPLLLVFEDVQWLDGASQELLGALAQEIPGAPIALVATYRSGMTLPWMNRPQAMQLSLPPLSPDHAAELASSVIDGGASSETVDAIVARADGNPFFIEELALAFSTGSGRTAPQTGLPESIVDVLRSRIFALGASARRGLVTASVAGRTCPLPLLRALVPAEPELEATLDELACAELVHVKTRGSERTLTFRHAVTQEVAYDLLSAGERRDLHGAAARALEAMHEGRHDEVIELLAHHHAKGDDLERAADVLLRAVMKVAAANAAEAARAHYNEAMRVLDTLPTTLENRRRRLQFHVGEHCVPVFFLIFQVDELLAVLEDLEADAHTLGDSALLGMYHVRKAHCFWWLGRFDEAVAEAEHALERIEPLGLPTLAAHTAQLNALHAKGDFQAILRLEPRVLAALEGEPSVRRRVYALGLLAWTHARLGLRDRAIALSEGALQLARERADAGVSSFVHWSFALVLADVDDFEQALDHARRAVADASTPADRMWAECTRAGVLCRRQEHAAEGTAILVPLVAQIRRSKQLPTECMFIPALGEGHVRLGQLDEGRAVFEGLLALAERHGMRYLEATACGWLAEIALRSGLEASPLRERADRILSELAVPRAGS